MIYHPHAQHIRYAYKLPSFVKLVIAFTVVPQAIDDLLIGSQRLHLEPLSEEGRREIIREICRLYQVAYIWKTRKSIEQEIYSIVGKMEPLRRFIKSIVEILDYARFYPSKSVSDLGIPR